MKRNVLPEAVERRHMGLTTNVKFKSSMLKMKLQQMSRSKSAVIYFQDTFNEDNSVLPYECKFVTIVKDCFLGAWSKGNCPYQSLYISDCPFYSKINDSFSDLSHISALMRNCEIVDMCGINIGSRELDYVLFIAESQTESLTHIQIVPREMNFPNMPYHSNLNSLQLEIEMSVYNCAWNAFTKTFVFGTNSGVIISKFENINPINGPPICPASSGRHFDMPYAVDINYRGDVLHFGFSDGFVAQSDSRCGYKSLSGVHFVGKDITKVKLLEDEVSLVIGGHNHKLCLVDTRMNSVVFNYSGHYNQNKKIPFHIDESLNVICSSGEDFVTRFWSLKHGDLLAELGPGFIRNPGCYIYSAVQAQGRKLYSYIFTGGDVYCLEPCCL